MAGLDVRSSNGFGDCDVPRLPIYVRSSRFHLPKSSRIPIIMIASGTGLAPFRAFIQERCAHASQPGQNAKSVPRALPFISRSQIAMVSGLGVLCHFEKLFERSSNPHGQKHDLVKRLINIAIYRNIAVLLTTKWMFTAHRPFWPHGLSCFD